MEDKQLNEKESLELISRMIRNSQSKLEKGDGTYFLVWGYTTIAVTIAMYFAVRFANNYWWNLLWFAIPALGWPLSILCTRKNNKEKSVTTYMDKVVGYIWMVLGIACFVLSALCILGGGFFNILLLVILLMSAGTALTGLVIKMKVLAVCGFVGMALSFGGFFLPGNYSNYLIFIAAFVIMMIIPGHIMNCKASKEVSNV